MKYEELIAVDLDHTDRLAGMGLDPRLIQNKHVFGKLGADFIANLKTCAISPFTGMPAAPVEHFGIDSDPWMHSILYKDHSHSFIIICQGMTSSGQLGAILLPRERLVLENRSTWYYGDVYDNRIHRNIPRILNFFRWRARNACRTPLSNRGILPCIGNERVGDFIMQLIWLDRLVAHPRFRRGFEVEHLLVNKGSEFLDVGDVFKEFAESIVKLQSIAHIEYHARHFRGPLLSDIWRLSDKTAVSDLMCRLNPIAKAERATPRVNAFLSDIDACPLRVWLSLELEKRVCEDQHNGLATVLKQISDEHLAPHEPLGLIFNGITGTVRGCIPSSLSNLVETEKEIASSIGRAIGRDVRCVLASGTTLAEKLVLAGRSDFVLAPLGSASIVPSLLLGKPGIVYGFNIDGYSAFIGDNTIVLDRRFIAERSHLKGAVARQTLDYVSYALDWSAMLEMIRYNFAFERTEGTRVNVRRLERQPHRSA